MSRGGTDFLVSRDSPPVILRVLQLPMLDVLLRIPNDGVSGVLRFRIRLGHLFTAHAADSADWVHAVVVIEMKLSSHPSRSSDNHHSPVQKSIPPQLGVVGGRSRGNVRRFWDR